MKEIQLNIFGSKNWHSLCLFIQNTWQNSRSFW